MFRGDRDRCPLLQVRQPKVRIAEDRAEQTSELLSEHLSQLHSPSLNPSTGSLTRHAGEMSTLLLPHHPEHMRLSFPGAKTGLVVGVAVHFGAELADNDVQAADGDECAPQLLGEHVLRVNAADLVTDAGESEPLNGP